MSLMSDAEANAVDLAVVAYRDDGDWSLAELPNRACDSVEDIAAELRRYPGETGTIAMLSIDEDFVLIVRVLGLETRVLLSDASAAMDWTLARDAVNTLGVHVDVDDDAFEPAGDLGLFTDLGLTAADLGEILDDLDLYPEEVLSEIASQLGFGEKFDELAGLS